MARKGTNDFNRQAKQFNKQVTDLMDRGYIALTPGGLNLAGMPRSGSVSTDSGNIMLDSCGEGAIGGAKAQRGFSFFDGKQSQPKAVPSQVGTPDLGYIPWGPKDDLPNQIFAYANALPYTAAALKYITDLTVGLGPKLMYTWPHYVNGSVKEELVPYEHAGVLIRGRMREVREKIDARNKAVQQGGGEAGGATTATEGRTIHFDDARRSQQQAGQGSAPAADKPLPGSYEEELMHLEADLAEWERTLPEVTRFTEENNLELHYQKCIVDDTHMDIYFPTYGLSRGRAGSWNPKIVSVGHLADVCTRMEQMDANWRVNYVYFSEKWRKDATAELEKKDVVAFPVLSPQSTLKDLRDVVERYKTAGIRRRPLWFCVPTFYPSMLKPYYPQPAWWSIFPSQIYNYASTLVYDKATARQNATMWGKMIFLNLSYFKQICDQQGVKTPEEVQQMKEQIYAQVENFLKKRENNGKTLFVESFLSQDEKTLWKSIEIVDVPQATIEVDTKEALGEISRTIFFALGVHPSLIGADPGGSSTGGTFQRELHLLKQQQVSPRQRIYLNFLNNIIKFNKWDSHATWIIREQVLTTLDRNANGMEETESKA